MLSMHNSKSDVVMPMKISVSPLFEYMPTITVLQSSKVLKLKYVIARENAIVGIFPGLCFCNVVQPNSVTISKRMNWSIKSRVDSNMSSTPGDSGSGRARLIRVLEGLQVKVIARIKGFQKGLPMKLMLFLVGFYSATAFATVIGQTGDWDILSAGLAVLVVEGIGALMYKNKNSFPLVNRIKGLITMFNYWKAGLSLGLFLDAFKYEMDSNIFGITNPFSIQFNFFSMFF